MQKRILYRIYNRISLETGKISMQDFDAITSTPFAS